MTNASRPAPVRTPESGPTMHTAPRLTLPSRRTRQAGAFASLATYWTAPKQPLKAARNRLRGAHANGHAVAETLFAHPRGAQQPRACDRSRRRRRIVVAAAALLWAGACASDDHTLSEVSLAEPSSEEGESVEAPVNPGVTPPNEPTPEHNEADSKADDESMLGYRLLTVDASDRDTWRYINLETRRVLDLTAEQAATDATWHLAVRRNVVRVNGGASGPGNVGAALAIAQDQLYGENGEALAEAFGAVNAETELPLLLGEVPIPRGLSSDTIESAFSDHFYTYNFGTGVASANPNTGFLVRSAEGNSFARMRCTEMDFPTRLGQGIRSFAFEFYVQGEGEERFAETPVVFSGSIGAAGGELCFDFDASGEDGGTADCTTGNWDVKLGFTGRNFYLRSHSGPSAPALGSAAGTAMGGVHGPEDWVTLLAQTQGQTGPDEATLIYQADAVRGIFDTQPWYAYNLAGDRALTPNFRVYVLRSDVGDMQSPTFALQVISYTSASGTPGHLTFRYRTLQP